MKDFKFRAYGASEASFSVANDLSRNHVPHIVISRRHDDKTFWYMLDVDDELLAKLRKDYLSPLEISLDLHEYRSYRTVKLDSASMFATLAGRSKTTATGEPEIILGESGEVRGFVNPGDPPPPQANRIYAGVSYEKTCVEPDGEMEFNLALGAEPQAGFGTVLPVKFPSDKEQIEIHAEVSSTDFSKPAGTDWHQTFTVDRVLLCKPANWTFKARGLGERARYSLAVEFSAEGTVLGSIVASLPRYGGKELPAIGTPGLLNLPSLSGARLHVRMTREGSGIVFNVSADGARQELPISSERDPQAFGYFFDKLTTAKSLTEIEQEIIYGLDVELPDTLKQILAQHAGVSTLFSGMEPLAPFELFQLNRRQNGPLLGIDRPVSRWITSAMDDSLSLKVRRVACIRPTYQGDDALPEAEKEEELLSERFKSNLVPVEDKKGFDALLNQTDIDLLHFAGHADGNPAYLRLPDYQVLPGSFGPSKPLFRNGKPFFFINGCRTAVGIPQAPAIVGNFARALLSSQCFCGVVAPCIKVDSKAALKVAEIFYDKTLTSGLSVDAALQSIRELALKDDVPDEERASMLSYLAFARPGLKLT